MKSSFLSVLIFNCLLGCTTLPEDPSPAPIDNGLWTLELNYNGKTDLGLLGAIYSKEDLDNELTIPLWHSGEVVIRSERCQFTETFSYQFDDSGSKKYKLKDLIANKPSAEFACIFNVVVFIHGFDKGFKGQFALVEKEEFHYTTVEILGRTFKGVGWYQLRQTVGESLEILFKIEGNKSGTMFFEGCGKQGELLFHGEFRVPLSFFTQSGAPTSCVYEIGLEYDDGERGIFTLNLKIFEKTLIEIPDPQISFKKGKLEIKASSPVAYVAIGNEIERGLEASSKVGDNFVFVRMVTANGRAKLLGIEKGVIVWKPSWKF